MTLPTFYHALLLRRKRLAFRRNKKTTIILINKINGSVEIIELNVAFTSNFPLLMVIIYGLRMYDNGVTQTLRIDQQVFYFHHIETLRRINGPL